jgi:hypothetical protein
MSPDRRIRPTLLVTALFALAASAPAGAAGDSGTREVSAYKLTDAGLAKYANATRRLDEAVRRSPALCEERANEDGEDTKTLDDLVAKIDANPQLRQAIQGAGMSTREYAVFSFAVLQAAMSAWALDQPGGKLAPGVSMDNVNFYRRNATTLKEIGDESNAAESCDGGSESGIDEEDAEADPAE